MELDFDKEIDALLRKGLNGRSPTGDALAPHLDADELSAFAENVLPAKTRAFHMAHIADCDRCRRILSNLVMLNAGTESEILESVAAAPAVVSVPEPWYRRLMLFPNLAYVMGGLVLVFGGLFAFSVLQSGDYERAASDEQITQEAPAARGPMASSEPDYSSMANTSANAANTAANVSSHSLASVSNSANKTAAGSLTNSNASGLAAPSVTAKEELDGRVNVPYEADVSRVSPPSPPPAAITQAAPVPATKDDSAATRALGDSEAEEKKKRTEADTRLRQSPRRDSGGVAKATPGPEMNRQVYPNQSSNTFELPTRTINGKAFSRRNNVWYDDSYKGQTTTNVRRNTDDYRKLDRGLRTIAESLDGVVVVVWTGKVYRIQ